MKDSTIPLMNLQNGGGTQKDRIEFQFAAKSLEATTWVGLVDPTESDEARHERAQYISRCFFGPGSGWAGKGFSPGTQLVITSAEVERFEFENGLAAIPIGAPYLDPENKYYSKELVAAVEVWRTLYRKGGKYNQKVAPLTQISKLLVERGLSKTAVERITTVVNPDATKKGGSPPSGPQKTKK